MSDESRLVRQFQALAFDERLVLMSLLRDAQRDEGRGLSITELAEAAGTSRFTTSRHLGVLRTAGMVSAARVGTRRVHTIRFAALAGIEDWVYAFTEVATTA
ncbi:ArsR/SmtB family transcription factor [Microbacterium aoyamense]|uniref:ArsR/SmtB family transcription factor n=1 Tax=Microbacterium aoyamense TaxID=344166 RepID=UPI0020046BB2|nr:helix-turn-helix domain-containing protein [Microbacterium aoyamense]